MKKLILVLLLLALLVGGFAAWKFFGPSITNATGDYFYIETGSNYNKVRKDLVGKQFLKDAYWFDLASRNFYEADVSLISLSDYGHLLSQAVQEKYVGEDDLISLKAWRVDPSHWKK